MDYKELGFKCGIECHQQLNTHKLFCHCPSLVRDPNKPDILIQRRLHTVAGETGEIDIAAKHEMAKDREFIYEACRTSSCLVELDECPPEPINEEAVDVALEISLLLNAKPVDEIQVMRKIVIDGSNVSGFQRTSLIAMDGFIETSQGKVSIPTICLEEESAQKVKEDKEKVIYRLDRLGIPLVEVATDTDIKSPEHAKEAASIIGMILRSTGKVIRGIGSIRQDVNVSIKNGARTEIKGFQDLKSIPKVIEYEIKRQLDLVHKGKKLKEDVRKAEPDFTTSFLRPMPGSARMYPETDVVSVKVAKERLNRIKLSDLISKKIENLEKKYGISRELGKELIEFEFFLDYIEQFKNIEPKFIAHVLVNIPKEIKTRFNIDASALTEEQFKDVLGYLNDGKIAKEAVIDILTDMVKGRKTDFSKFKIIDEKELEREIKKLVEEKKGLSIGALMGILMAKYRGKVDGKKIMDILKKYVK